MSKRNTQQRRHSIVALVQEKGQVTVEELAESFSTSLVTIRKDLTLLENDGLLLRRYGGAVPVPKELMESDLENQVSSKKVAIGKAAAQKVRDYNRIIIDSGTTTSTMIPELEGRPGLVVMTNSLSLANKIHELEHEPMLLMTGGTWDPHSEAFQGKVAEQVLRSYDFDQLFIGADGIDLERGSTTFNELTGLSQVMAEVAREIILMIESDKIDRRIPNLELSWSVINCVVTDEGISKEQKKKIESYGVEVICAKD